MDSFWGHTGYLAPDTGRMCRVRCGHLREFSVVAAVRIRVSPGLVQRTRIRDAGQWRSFRMEFGRVLRLVPVFCSAAHDRQNDGHAVRVPSQLRHQTILDLFAAIPFSGDIGDIAGNFARQERGARRSRRRLKAAGSGRYHYSAVRRSLIIDRTRAIQWIHQTGQAIATEQSGFFSAIADETRFLWQIAFEDIVLNNDL